MHEAPVTVRDAPQAQSFEAIADGVVVGRVEYLRTHELVVLKHTDVDCCRCRRGKAWAKT